MILGKHITVTHASNPGLVGLEGEVVEDNRDTLRVRTQRGEKLLVKDTVTIRADGQTIEGKSLAGTHAARSKK